MLPHPLRHRTIISFSLFCFAFLFFDAVHAQKKSIVQTPVSGNEIYNKKLFSGLKWRCIGPFRSGRSTAVTGVVNQPMVYYAGQTGGGVWKTTDGGNTWLCVSDSIFTSSSVGALAVAKSNPNIIYAGTGEVEMRNNISFGDGVYKSSDAGKTWKHIGLEKSYAIGTIAVDPQNPDIVYAAALGKIFGANKERGLYRSKDGGANWQQVLNYDDSTGCVDVKIDPNNPLIIYASMWRAHRTPYSLSSGGKGSGLYKSMDGGNTWKLISENPGMPKGLMGKIICTISPVNSQRIFAVVENEHGGVLKSEDGGENWTVVSTQNDLTQRPWYFSQIFADTKNENTLYILNVEFFKSIDAGVSWTRVANRHGDNHDMWINPDNASNWIMGDDGGPQVTFDGGKNFSDIDLPTAQFYHVNLDNDFPYHVYGAQQDNTSIKIASRTNDFTIGLRDWYPVAGGEAGYIVPDPNNPDITYGGEYDGQLTSFNKKTGVYHALSPDVELHQGAGAEDYKFRFNWTFPISISPFNPKMIYAGSNYVLRTVDAGQNWKVISPDLTRHDPKTLKPSGGPITLDNTGAEVYADVFAVAESPVKQGVIWAGSDDGLVHVTKDDGKNWMDVTPKSLPDWALISYVEPSHFDSATCYVSATRYKSDDTKPYVFKTNDFGKTWTLITNGLPANTYNRCVREDPKKKGILYCGLETGIYISFDDGAHWQSLQLNLPNTPVHDIQIQTRENDLVIATHGRSFWILDDITPLYQLSDEIAKSNHWLFKPRDSYRVPGGYIEDDAVQEGQNAPNGVMVRYYLKTKPDKELKLKFFSTAGDSIITYSNLKDNKGELVKISKDYYESKAKRPGLLATDTGMNVFVWDIHYPAAKADTSATFEGSLSGPLAAPGSYVVKMFIGDSLIQSQAFTILKDPRNDASVDDLKEHFELSEKVVKKLNEVGKATKQIRLVSDQIEAFCSHLTDSTDARHFRALSKPIIDSLTTIKDALYNSKIKAGEDNLRFPMRLEEKLSGVNAVLTSVEQKPTAAMYESYNSLVSRIDVQLQKLAIIFEKQIPAFNSEAKTKQRDAIEINTKE
ncbi:MAG: glycosyl hydrolase [Bacteroidota bacterium]|nr:glycosyl hydrolase [Bacteroidota bacterium]